MAKYLAVLVLILSMFNLSQLTKKTVSVLGESTENTFFTELVKNHPTYRDGWIELGRMDKVKIIDPNFIQP